MDPTKLPREIKSPLRYPGGKSRAIPKILGLVPPFSEYREPFVGGGSVFVAVKQRASPGTRFIINDLNADLFAFWKVLRDDPGRLLAGVARIRASGDDGHEVNRQVRAWACKDDVERAIRFFVINRTSFSGLSDSGGFSIQAFKNRFTASSIERARLVAPLLAGVDIANQDYQPIVEAPGEHVFIFLDPPYVKATEKRLYGKGGDLHLAFNHERFASVMKTCPHKWLVTYDDCPEVRELFSFATIVEWELQYGMNNYMQGKADAGKELFIMNYDPGLAAGDRSNRGQRFASLEEYV